MAAAQLDLLEATARAYDTLLVPALFQPFARSVATIAGIQPGNSVLDVGCGTGALTRELAVFVEHGGDLYGLDLNPGMLSVAYRSLPGVEFRQGDASSIPFENNFFGCVVSQFALMLFEDRRRSLGEMWRVLDTGGQMTVAVFQGLDKNKAYETVAGIYERHVGPSIANALRFPFSLGDEQELTALFSEAGITGIELKTVKEIVHFGSADHLARADIDGWFPFAGFAVSASQRDTISANIAEVFDAS
ncbi:MAG: methyltransferase domain-containing protein, partial [Pseudomonadota bacterium]